MQWECQLAVCPLVKQKSLLLFCLGVVLYLLLTSLKVKSISGNREQGSCKVRWTVPLWAYQCWQNRQTNCLRGEWSREHITHSRSLSAPRSVTSKSMPCHQTRDSPIDLLTHDQHDLSKYSKGASTVEDESKCLLAGWVNKCKWIKPCTKPSELS